MCCLHLKFYALIYSGAVVILFLLMHLSHRPLLKTLLCTVFALIAFAANSVLCRLALGKDAIDASGFTIIRLLAGIGVLMLILKVRPASKAPARGSWISALLLFGYAITFSFAYISLDTGTGALVLFGAVQLTIILTSIFSGQKLHWPEWTGVILAFSGFTYLVAPNITTPSFSGFLLMTLAGIAWGGYTLRGKASIAPLQDTAFNFLRTAPFVGILALITFFNLQASWEGVMLAVLSGALASGLGYTVWYIALGGLSTTEAAVVQLSVPVIAAIGGVLFVSEAITLRLIIASIFILGGILIVVSGRAYLIQRPAPES